jgi:hypothetical protein
MYADQTIPTTIICSEAEHQMGPTQTRITSEVRVLVPSGMLGGGFPAETIERGLTLGADVIAVDGGSTDSGPYYLGTATAKTPEQAVARDLRILLIRARQANVPLIVGSCGTSGTDAGVDWIAGIVRTIARQESLQLNLARIYSSQTAAEMATRLSAGRVIPLQPARIIDENDLKRCEHIVGVMGYEPIAEAIQAGANVVVAGRATDTAVLAAVPLMRGCPPGPSWHAAKIAECGGQCTTNPRAGGVLITVDGDGFTVEPLSPEAACSPSSVAAHMLYENADPYRMREPGGTIDTTDAVYTALDDRRVRVQGSRFEPADQYTVKLEGSAIAGYQTISVVGIRNPEILGSIGEWSKTLEAFLVDGIETVLGLGTDDYSLEFRYYGWNAILGALDTDERTPREVGAVLMVTAPNQTTATSIAKYANPYLLHMPLPGMTHLPSFAFMTSPAEIERGAIYEFVLNHSVEVDGPDELIRTETELIG